MIKKLKYILGRSEDFSLEERLFNATMLYSLACNVFTFVLMTYIPFHQIFLKTYIASTFLNLLFFYLSRVRKKFELAAWFFLIGGLVTTSINWFTDSGLIESTILYFIGNIILFSFIFDNSKRIIALLILIISFLIIIKMGVQKYESIITAKDIHFQHIRVISGFMFLNIFVAIIISMIKNNYRKQKAQSENALIESKNQLNRIIENTNDIIFIVQNDKIQLFNPEIARLLDYSIEDLSTRKYSDFFYKDDKELIINIQDKVIVGEKLAKSEPLRFRNQAGMYRWVEINCVRIEWKEEPAVMNFMFDVTEKKISEEILKKSEKQLRASNNMKDKLFSIIAHDLRGPISNVKALLDMMLKSRNSLDIKNDKEALKMAKDTVNSTFNLLENLLDWSRSQIGRINWRPEKLNLNEVVNENIILLNIPARKKKIIWNVEIVENLHAVADRQMISTVLRNLISNAIKFTPREGEVSISAKIYEELDNEKVTTKNKPSIVIMIKDTGIGIKSDDLSKLFRIDMNFSTLGTESEKGTGLGLLLSKEFVEKNGGKIWVTSELGKGSIFNFTMPLCEE